MKKNLLFFVTIHSILLTSCTYRMFEKDTDVAFKKASRYLHEYGYSFYNPGPIFEPPTAWHYTIYDLAIVREEDNSKLNDQYPGLPIPGYFTLIERDQIRQLWWPRLSKYIVFDIDGECLGGEGGFYVGEINDQILPNKNNFTYKIIEKKMKIHFEKTPYTAKVFELPVTVVYCVEPKGSNKPCSCDSSDHSLPKRINELDEFKIVF